tara:strand:+ start:191 stop:1108 length:918 start_codon:yes stop_codon:yes gene_type:complete
MNLINIHRGLVTKKFNDFFYVDILKDEKNSECKRFLCKSRKSLKHQQKYIVVGDKVLLNEINYKEKTAVIENLLERKNIINRPAVANISDIYIIQSVKHPKLNYLQLSNFLINAESLMVKVSLILTKSDLISIEKHFYLFEKFKNWGYEPKILSLNSNNEFKELIHELKTKKCSIFMGPSGVGKTTLLNKIIPSVNRATAAVSDKIKRGKNTTRNIELFQLSDESYIVDTPGFNILNNYMKPKDIAYLFPEFKNQINQNKVRCKFRDCLHIDEPGCNLNKKFERYEFYKILIRDSKILCHQTQAN